MDAPELSVLSADNVFTIQYGDIEPAHRHAR
jgi:hypothetical protein